LGVESISVFDIFKIGVGPSSSHTMGPWRAAQQFLAIAQERGEFDQIASVRVDLFGSLAKTGKGHGTDIAVLMGLTGEDPVTTDTAEIHPKVASIRLHKKLLLGGEREIPFDFEAGIVFHRAESLPFHPNGLRFTSELLDGSTHSETAASSSAKATPTAVAKPPTCRCRSTRPPTSSAIVETTT
jgi:L-serine dehydratase